MDAETTRLDVTRAFATPGPTGVVITFFHAEGATTSTLADGGALEIGRAPTCDVVLPDDSLSRRHARLRLVAGQLYAEDLGSTNGTRVGERRIREETPIGPGELVSFGDVAARIVDAGGALRLASHAEGFDPFCRHVADELVRARHFQRTAAVLAVRALDPSVHALEIATRVSAHLRPIDRVAQYSKSLVVVLLSEADEAQARAVARAIVGASDGPRLVVGLAVFPPHATTAEALLEEARTSAARAGQEEPISAPRAGERQLLPSGAPPRVVMSAAMVALYQTVERLHRSSIPVLLLGETGVGKEVIARALHEGGPRASRPLVAVNCGALTGTLIESTLFGHEKGAFTGADRQHKGVFEAAEGGTVFLDEIGELDLALQPKLLRVLETRRVTRVGGTKEIDVDVRVVAATHRNLEDMVAQGRFREDLFFRLNGVALAIPPLRHRREEIVPLAELFLARAFGDGVAPRLTREAHDLLLAYPWPGNARELKNAMERAAAIAGPDSRGQLGEIGPADLPEALRRFSVPAASPRAASAPLLPPGETADLKTLVRNYEVRVIEEALQASGFNQTLAAQRLRTPLRTLVHKIKVLSVRKGPGE